MKQLAIRRQITDILEDMDRLDEVVITDDLVNILRSHFKEEIKHEEQDKAPVGS